MADREERGRGRPGEMEAGGISPVVGDIERRTTSAAASRGEAARVLRGLAYPLARDDLVREAAVHDAGSDLLDRLSRLPDRVYGSAEDVADELQRPR